ncbi:mitochondrial glycoprotein [Jackrogersella minutella]|nr:mitochondrial glycoprotein [Jackrogersella minutella]
MLSLRAVARSAPRTISRIGATTIRQSRVARPSCLKSALAPLRSSQFASAFSTTPTQFKKAEGSVDAEFATKLESEIQFEDQMKEVEGPSASIKDFLENTPFKLEDIPGKEDVTLTRKYGNETITVTFSISDLATDYQNSDMYNNEEALGDEEEEIPEARSATEEGVEEDEDDSGESEPVPFRLNVVVEKPGKGALSIEALAQDGQVTVENFYYFKDPKLAHGASAEAEHGASNVFPGPPFGSLDEDLQLIMERYLEERGVTQALAVFVPDYMDLKEQREYQNWLQNVKNFVEG